MQMIEIQFETGPGAEWVKCVRWPAVPRVGEVVDFGDGKQGTVRQVLWEEADGMQLDPEKPPLVIVRFR